MPAIQERDGFVRSERIRVRTVSGCRNEDALHCSFVHDRSVQVADGGDTNRVRISLRLDHDLAATNGIGTERDRVHAAVPTGLGHLDFSTVTRKLLAEYFADEMFERLPGGYP